MLPTGFDSRPQRWHTQPEAEKGIETQTTAVIVFDLKADAD